MGSQLDWLREHVCGTLGLEPSLFDKATEREDSKALLAQFLRMGACRSFRVGLRITPVQVPVLVCLVFPKLLGNVQWHADDANAATDSLVVRYRVPQPVVAHVPPAQSVSSAHQARRASAVSNLDHEQTEAGSGHGELNAHTLSEEWVPDMSASADETAHSHPDVIERPEADEAAPVGDVHDGEDAQSAAGSFVNSDAVVAAAPMQGSVSHGLHDPEASAAVAEAVCAQPYIEISTDCGGEDGGAPAAFIVRRRGGTASDDPAESIDVGTFAQQGGLQGIGALLEHFYLPLLVADTPGGDGDSAVTVGAAGAQHAADADLLAAMQKFLGQVKLGSAHLTGNIKLRMPEQEVSGVHERDDELLQALEHVLHDWALTLQKLKQAQASKTAGQDGPLDEIDYWSERNNVLGGLHEQLQQARVQAIIQCAFKQPLWRSRRVWRDSGLSGTLLQVCRDALNGPEPAVVIQDAGDGAGAPERRGTRQRQVPVHAGAPFQSCHARPARWCAALRKPSQGGAVVGACLHAC